VLFEVSGRLLDNGLFTGGACGLPPKTWTLTSFYSSLSSDALSLTGGTLDEVFLLVTSLCSDRHKINIFA